MKPNTQPTQPIVDPEEMFPTVEKMIYDLAWKFSNTYPITFEECKSEAYYAFVKCCYDFKNDRKTKFSTWCYYWVWCKLKDLVMFRSKDPLLFVEEVGEDLGGLAPELRSDALEMVEDLSGDAQEIISLLVDTPAELLGRTNLPAKQLLVKVKQFLVNQGRDARTVERASEEIRLRLRGAPGFNDRTRAIPA